MPKYKVVYSQKYCNCTKNLTKDKKIYLSLINFINWWINNRIDKNLDILEKIMKNILNINFLRRMKKKIEREIKRKIGRKMKKKIEKKIRNKVKKMTKKKIKEESEKQNKKEDNNTNNYNGILKSLFSIY